MNTIKNVNTYSHRKDARKCFHHCTHPSLFTGVGFHRPSAKCEDTGIIDGPPTKVSRIFLVFFFSSLKNCGWSCFYFSSIRWTSRGMAGRPVRVVEQFWFFYSLKGPNDVVWFLGATPRICETSKYEPMKSEGWVFIWDPVLTNTYELRVLLT